jgi:archaellum component FlaF (FlaF/FlaG flagellin family)
VLSGVSGKLSGIGGWCGRRYHVRQKSVLKLAVFTLAALFLFLVLLIIFPIGMYDLRDHPPIKINVIENSDYSKVDVIRQVKTAANIYGWKVIENGGKMKLTKYELIFNGTITINCNEEYILPGDANVRRSYLHQLMCEMDNVDFAYDICVKAIR